MMPVTIAGDVVDNLGEMFGPQQAWSWVLTAVGCTALLIAGRGFWAGWLLGLAAQLLWVAYAVVTDQYGFIVSALVYGLVYVVNIARARSRTTTATAVLTVVDEVDETAAHNALTTALFEVRTLGEPTNGRRHASARVDADRARFVLDGLAAQGYTLTRRPGAA